MHKWFAIVAIGVLVVGVSACGGASKTAPRRGSTSGSNTSAASALTTSAEAICAKRNNAIAAVSSGVGSEKSIKHIARERAAVEQSALEELSRLTAPASLEPNWRTFIAYRRTLIQDWTRLVKEGLSDGYGTALTAAAQTQSNMLAVAKRIGFVACTQTN
jgi:hypothetical protein